MVKVEKQAQTAKQTKNRKDAPCIVHTLGQLGHNQCQQGFQPTKKDKTYLQKRAKNAYFSKGLARELSHLESPLHKAYKRTVFDCCSTLMQEGKKLTSKYCDGRWCNTCNRIRTAKLINGYLKPLQQLEQPYFVTLTIPNVTGSELRHSIIGMVQTFSNSVKAIRRAKNSLTNGFNGIRKLECTYNAETNEFHPHFHCIVDGQINAVKLVHEWLKRYPSANNIAQDIRQADESSLKELFKYTTKIVTKATDGFKIYVPALDTIFNAMYKLRTFQSFGKIRMVKEDIDELQADDYEIPHYDFLVWQWIGEDWQSMATGEMLTGYKPSKAMVELITEKMIV